MFCETALGRSFSDDPIRMDKVWQDLFSFESVETPSPSHTVHHGEQLYEFLRFSYFLHDLYTQRGWMRLALKSA